MPVQFNPTSLRWSRTNNVDDSGKTTQDQQRRYAATKPASLSVDLEFDTAEEGAAPVDVRGRTKLVRQFVDPPPLVGPGGASSSSSGPADPETPPPAVRFRWGPFSFTGIVTSLSEEIDYFAEDGTPLRAKLGLQIQEWDLRLQTKAGGGGRTGPGPTSLGGASSPAALPAGSLAGAPAGGAAAAANTPAPSPGPGSAGTGSPKAIVAAQGGESAQQLAARLGGDPTAWRSLMTALGSPLALPAGTPVQVGAELRAGTGSLGRATGFEVSGEASRTEVLARALGLSPRPAVSVALSTGDVVAGETGLGARAEAGFVLSAAGGLRAATAAVAVAEASARTAAARAAFEVSTASGGTSAAVPGTGGAGGDPPTDQRAPDPRAEGYGRGVPLQARVEARTRARAEAAQSTRPPWVLLPPSAERTIADRAQAAAETPPGIRRWSPSQAYC